MIAPSSTPAAAFFRSPLMNRPAARVSVVVLTHNRCREVVQAVAGLHALPERVPIVVVDNGSTDDTVARLRAGFPDITLIEARANLGAAGRNLGVAALRTPYVAFCDDDTCWQPHALSRAVDMLDAHPRVAVLVGRVWVGAANDREDPTCTAMGHSPLGAIGPGQRLLGFLAGASVMRTDAFRAMGGYEPRLFIGGEEMLLALDLAASGWEMVYTDAIATCHVPSAARDAQARRRLLARNAVWIACMRLPWSLAWREVRQAGGAMRREPAPWRAMRETLAGLPWALRRRRVVPAPVQAMWRALHR